LIAKALRYLAFNIKHLPYLGVDPSFVNVFNRLPLILWPLPKKLEIFWGGAIKLGGGG